MPLQHFGEAECDCLNGDLENISTGDEGTVEGPAATNTRRMLAFRSHSSNGSQWLSPGVIPGCYSPCLPKRSGLAMLGLEAVSSESNT